jgi:hypothetical protein
MTRPYEKERAEALAALAEKDPRSAFAKFRFVLEYPGKLGGREDFVDALGVLAQIAEPIAGGEVAGLLRGAAERPDDPEALYELGYQLIEQGLHGIAATVLARGLSFAPGNEAFVTELVCALEGSDRSAAACQVLRAAPQLVEESFACRYLLAFNAIMSAHLETPRALWAGLEKLADPTNEGHDFMRATVAGMLARAGAIAGVAKLDDTDLRGWHFVVTGGLLTHVSPFGFEEGMHGRYAFTQDFPSRCVEGIHRLRAVLGAFRVAPPRLLYLPDRDSEIFGLAAAELLGLPATPWPAGGDDEGPALIVAYDLANVEPDALRSLDPRRAGQILFAHAASWTDPPPFAPDVATYLYQVNQLFWGERLGVDPATHETRPQPPDTRPVEAIALEIVEAEPEDGALDDLPGLVALAEKIATLDPPHGQGAFASPGERRRFWPTSAVKSSRFL